MAEYISGEKHRELRAQHGSKSPSSRPLLPMVVVVVLMGLSFYGGTAYQKSHQSRTVATTTGANGGGFAGRHRFGGQRPTIGQVTAVSASSISVQDSASGSSTTLSITSNTQISDNGQTVAASDITVGENVLVVASTTDKTQAARILVNPSLGNGSGGSTPTPSSTTN